MNNVLQQQRPVSKRSHVSALNPFIDEDGLIRVGRLRHSDFPKKIKHPIIIFSYPLIVDHLRYSSASSSCRLYFNATSLTRKLLVARQIITLGSVVSYVHDTKLNRLPN